jgi:arylsulfatase
MKHIWIPLFLLAVTASVNAQDTPNVVMLADNVGYGDLGAYGTGEVRGIPTPRIDQLARERLRLTQFLVEPGGTRKPLSTLVRFRETRDRRVGALP